ncbi:hypothetical protein EKM03_11840 [Flavobacterium sp. GSP6]|nr:hypothetical protein EKM03_11840 [Flavobacterium sp. GSP6]
MVAFSGVAMAGTHEVKEMEVLSEECYVKAADYVDNEYDPNGTHTDAQNEAAYQGYYDACEANKTPRITEN